MRERGWRAGRAGGGGGARPPAGRCLRTCIPRGARASGGPACAGARCRSAAGERGGQAGAGAEFLQSLTWLPFGCCSIARRRWARQAAAAWRRGQHAHNDHKIRRRSGVGAREPRASALRPRSSPQQPGARKGLGTRGARAIPRP